MVNVICFDCGIYALDCISIFTVSPLRMRAVSFALNFSFLAPDSPREALTHQLAEVRT